MRKYDVGKEEDDSLSTLSTCPYVVMGQVHISVVVNKTLDLMATYIRTRACTQWKDMAKG